MLIKNYKSAAVIMSLVLSAITLYADDVKKKPTLQPSKLGSTRNVHRFGKTLLAGQPSAEELAQAKKRGIETVITLRPQSELDWEESAVAKNLGLEFYQFGLRAPESFTDEVFNAVRKILTNPKKQPVLLHCSSANRVGAIWAAHRALDQGLSIDQAIKEAKAVGMRTPGYEEQVRDYVRRNKQ